MIFGLVYLSPLKSRLLLSVGCLFLCLWFLFRCGAIQLPWTSGQRFLFHFLWFSFTLGTCSVRTRCLAWSPSTSHVGAMRGMKLLCHGYTQRVSGKCGRTRPLTRLSLFGSQNPLSAAPSCGHKCVFYKCYDFCQNCLMEWESSRHLWSLLCGTLRKKLQKTTAHHFGWNMFNVAKRLMPSYSKVQKLMPI